MRRKSVLFRVAIILIPIVLIAMTSLTVISYYTSKALVNKQIDQSMNNKIQSESEFIQKILLKHAQIAKSLVAVAQTSGTVLSKQNYIDLLEKIIKTNDDTYGAGVWFEPNKYKADLEFFGPYAYKDGNNTVYTDQYNDPKYNYPTQDWYKMALDLNKDIAWSLPYYDKGTNTTMITAASHFLDKQGNILGVTTADINLTAIQNNIDSIKVGDTGKVFLIDKSGLYIAFDDKSRVMKKKIQEDSEHSIALLGKQMIANEKGQGIFTENNAEYRVYYNTIPGTNLIIGLKIKNSELMSSVYSLLIKSIAMTVIFVILLVVAIILVVRKITDYLKVTVHHMNLISKGDLATQVPTQFVNIQSEIGELARSTQNMQQSLRKLIQDMKDVARNVITHSSSLNVVSEEMTASTHGVSQAISDIAKGTIGQADDLVSITGAVNDFGDEIGKMVTAIKEITTSTNGINEKAIDSNEKMQLLIKSINNVSVLYNGFDTQITGFTTNINKINEITSLINSIAEQTNLLALNAAIEAARAGEAGKGFAVVADEIRKLAEQSKESSDNIKKLVINIGSSMENIVEASNNIDKEISSEELAVSSTIEAFELIIKEINTIIPKIKVINESSLLIDKEKENIAGRIESISAVAEEVSASAEEISASSDEMNNSAEQVANTSRELNQMTKEMKTQLDRFLV